MQLIQGVRTPDILGCSTFPNTTSACGAATTVSITVRFVSVAVDVRYNHGKEVEEYQTADAHFQSSSAFPIVLHKRIMSLIRILPG